MVVHSYGNAELVAQVFHDLDGLAGTGAVRDVAVDGRRRVHVVAHVHDRAADVFHVAQRAQRDHVAQLVADFELADVGGADAVLLLGQDVDLPGAAELVEQVDVVAAHVGRERVEHVFHGHGQRAALGAVDIDIELRRVGAEHGEQADQERIGVAVVRPGRSVACC